MFIIVPVPVLVIPIVGVQPAGPALRPLPVDIGIELVGNRPPFHREPRLVVGHNRPVRKRDGRALLQEPAIRVAPAHVAVHHLPDTRAGPAGDLLELLDGELRPPRLRNQPEYPCLDLGKLRLLPAGRPVQVVIEPDRIGEVLAGGQDAGRAVLCPGRLPLHAPEKRMGLDEVQEHLGVPAVGRVAEPDPPGERDDHEHPAGPEIVPQRLAENHLLPFPDRGRRHRLVLLQDAGEHPGVLLRGIIDPAGEHPV